MEPITGNTLARARAPAATASRAIKPVLATKTASGKRANTAARMSRRRMVLPEENPGGLVAISRGESRGATPAVGWPRNVSRATSSACRPPPSTAAAARPRHRARASPPSAGTMSWVMPASSSSGRVRRPQCSCSGASGAPGSPRCEITSRRGSSKTACRLKSGFRALRTPAFCMSTTGFLPARTMPAAMPTASPSSVAMSSTPRPARSEKRGASSEHGTPTKGEKPCRKSAATISVASLTSLPECWSAARPPRHGALPVSRPRHDPILARFPRWAGRRATPLG